MHLFRGLLWRAFVEYVGHVHSNQYMRQRFKQAMWNETAMGMITRSPIDDIPNLFEWSGLWQIECHRKPVGAREQRIHVLESKVVVVYACTAVPRASAPARPRLPSAPSSPLLQPRARGVLFSCQSTRVNRRRARAIKPSLPRPTRRRSHTERERARAPPHLSEGRSFPRSKAGRACRTRRTAAARGGFSVRWAWRGCVAGHVDPGSA